MNPPGRSDCCQIEVDGRFWFFQGVVSDLMKLFPGIVMSLCLSSVMGMPATESLMYSFKGVH